MKFASFLPAMAVLVLGFITPATVTAQSRATVGGTRGAETAHARAIVVTVLAGGTFAGGPSLDDALSEFVSTTGQPGAAAVPVAAAGVGFGYSVPLGTVFFLDAGVELRRLGYATAVPDLSSMSWMNLWSVGGRMGLSARLGPAGAGAGVSVLMPVFGPSYGTMVDGAGMTVTYDTVAGKLVVPGGYLSLCLDASGLMGSPARPTPDIGLTIGVEAGLWPVGIIDGVDAWQASVGLSVQLAIPDGVAR